MTSENGIGSVGVPILTLVSGSKPNTSTWLRLISEPGTLEYTISLPLNTIRHALPSLFGRGPTYTLRLSTADTDASTAAR